ncbi:hypothetical protein SESBI_32920 [Sesbania bispinosa]|nr:hypothetical protein SESBI_32920 [Sesbania bispinosa]
MATASAIPGNLPVFDRKGYEDWCIQVLEQIAKSAFPLHLITTPIRIRKCFYILLHGIGKVNLKLIFHVSLKIVQRPSKTTPQIHLNQLQEDLRE